MGRGGHRSVGSDAPIEFLPPDSHAFATSSADGFVDVGADVRDEFGDERPRSPWVTFGTAAGVVAMFTIGLVAAAPWSSDEPAARAPRGAATSTVPSQGEPTYPDTSTADATPTTVLTIDDDAPPPPAAQPLPESGYIAAEPPEGFDVSGLYTVTAENEVVWLELWATTGARRARGAWFAVQVDPQATQPAGTGAERVDVGRNGIGLLTHTTDGIAVLNFALSQGAGAVITAGGWADDALVAMAAGIGHVGVRPVFADESTGDHELVWSGLTVGRSVEDVFAYGDVRSALRYERRADHKFISIVAAPSGGPAEVLSKFVLAEDPDFPLSGPNVRIGINGRRMTAGVLPGLEDARVARWVENDEQVTVLSNLPLADLLDIVAGVHRATAESWRDAMIDARGVRPDVAANAPKDEIGGGVLEDGSSWRVELDASGNFATVETAGMTSTRELSPHEEPLYLFSTVNATLVIARVPSTVETSFVLHVEGPLTTVDVSLVPAGAIGTPVAAAHAFGAIGAFTASLLVDGTPVATLTGGASGISRGA